MTMLFDTGRHEAATTTPWDEARARHAIAQVVQRAHDDFEGERWWPCHPLDDPDEPDARHAMLYFGAGGVIWALEHLADAGAAPRLRDYSDTVAGLVEHNRETLQRWEAAAAARSGGASAGHGSASLLMGDAGLLLLQRRLGAGAVVEEKLYQAVSGNLRNPTREALWGSPGTLLAALAMAQREGSDARWRELFAEGVEILWSEMDFDTGCGAWLWQQDMYGKQVRYVGAGHGFAGNLYPVMHGAALLPPDRVAAFAERALETLRATSISDGSSGTELISWHAYTLPERPAGRLPIVQDCHGAPGIVCRFADAPNTPDWNRLLRGGAELTWHAGPLAKGAGLCHGTAGNGYALLKQWRRSGDAVWLDRARVFAMHAIEQLEQQRTVHGAARHSLWTGDEGVAIYLHACIVGDASFPTLDIF